MNDNNTIIKPASMVIELDIIDDYGRKVKSPYKIQKGANKFTCEATYVDNTTERFAAFWTCPMILPRGDVDFYGALGVDKQISVIVNADTNHIRYLSLTCWVKFPDGPDTDAGQYPNKAIEFDYLEISNA